MAPKNSIAKRRLGATKASIINEMISRAKVTATETDFLIDFIEKSIKSALERGEEVHLKSFGCLKPAMRRTRRFGDIKITRFVPSRNLVRQVNESAKQAGITPE